jgi:hypothetical protein
MTETSKKVWKAFWENTKYPENIDPWNLANALREVINELQHAPGVIMCADVLELCDELEKL